MRVHFKAQHPIFGRADKPLGLAYQQRSPYYWWWEFLRRNEKYLACCETGDKGKLAALYADFGDVRNDTFKKWWTAGERGAKLFGEKPLPLSLKELASASEWDASWSRESVMVVAVPLEVAKRRLQSYFAQLLKKRHKGQRGRKALSDKDASSARYPLSRNVSIHTLRIQLSVYDAVIANRSAEKKRTLAEIGASLRLVPTAMPDKKDDKRDAALKRNVMAATVSRYFKEAECIVLNTAKGQFPNSKA